MTGKNVRQVLDEAWQDRQGNPLTADGPQNLRFPVLLPQKLESVTGWIDFQNRSLNGKFFIPVKIRCGDPQHRQMIIFFDRCKT